MSCPEKLKKLTSACDIIRNTTGPFAKCIRRKNINAKKFHEACLADVCSYSQINVSKEGIACRMISAFAEECAENGLSIKWRRHGFCGEYNLQDAISSSFETIEFRFSHFVFVCTPLSITKNGSFTFQRIKPMNL